MFGLKQPIKRASLCLKLLSTSKRSSDYEVDILYCPAKVAAVSGLNHQEQINLAMIHPWFPIHHSPDAVAVYRRSPSVAARPNALKLGEVIDTSIVLWPLSRSQALHSYSTSEPWNRTLNTNGGTRITEVTEVSKKPCQMRPPFGPLSYLAVAIPLYLSTVELLPEPDQLIPLSRDRGGMGSVPAKHGPVQGGTQVTFHGSGDSNTIGPLQDAH